ncbi:succinate dehydrogenase [Aestuariibius insulae]|uniref:succinate dehydrogenase n=1 Tax=Aestuariibius insulae TaxID=2058287 RepID=UPI00345EA777
MRPLLFMAAVSLTAACTTNPDFADSLARESAKSVVSGIIATRFPGLQVAPVTDCVIDNATSSEIILIARGALTGPTAETTSTVVEIAGRPDTIRCIAQTGPSVLTG